MAQRIDWNKMASDLGTVLTDVSNEARANGIIVTITQGKQPPRLYAEFDYPEEMQGLYRDLSPEAEQRHAELSVKFSTKTLALAGIMKQHGLKGYNMDPHFRSPYSYTTIFGFDHDLYRISK